MLEQHPKEGAHPVTLICKAMASASADIRREAARLLGAWVAYDQGRRVEALQVYTDKISVMVLSGSLVAHPHTNKSIIFSVPVLCVCFIVVSPIDRARFCHGIERRK